MRLELFGWCKAGCDELSNFALFGLGLLGFIFGDYPAAQHSLVAWVTSFCAPEGDAEPTISCFQQGTARPGCTKPAGQSQPLGVAFSMLCLLRVGED